MNFVKDEGLGTGEFTTQAEAVEMQETHEDHEIQAHQKNSLAQQSQEDDLSFLKRVEKIIAKDTPDKSATMKPPLHNQQQHDFVTLRDNNINT